MVRVKGPLFSVSASGVFKDELEFRTANGQTVVGKRRAKPATRSAAQQAQSARFAESVSGWQALDSGQKQAWKTAAQGTGMTGYQLYLSEYQAQLIQAPAQPVPP